MEIAVIRTKRTKEVSTSPAADARRSLVLIVMQASTTIAPITENHTQNSLFNKESGSRTKALNAMMMFDRFATIAGAPNVFARAEKLSPMIIVYARHPAKHVATQPPAGSQADFSPTVRAQDCSYESALVSEHERPMRMNV